MSPVGRATAAFLVDVDNTLLDNDRVTGDLWRYLDRTVGPEGRARYWAHFERLRVELGYADYLGALQRYRLEFPRDPHVLAVSAFLIDYPFANRLYPGALDVLERFRGWGPTVILSDGDVVFQPRKVQHSGLWEAVEGRVLSDQLLGEHVVVVGGAHAGDSATFAGAASYTPSAHVQGGPWSDSRLTHPGGHTHNPCVMNRKNVVASMLAGLLRTQAAETK